MFGSEVAQPSSMTIPQHRPAAVVELGAHQGRRELDDMRDKAHVPERIRRLEAEQAAADRDAGFGIRTGRPDRVEVFDGAVDVAVRQVAAVDRRHERIGTRREDQGVVADTAVPVGAYDARRTVDRRHPFADVHGSARGGSAQRQVVHARAGEVVAQVDAVISRPRLLAEHRDRHTRDGGGEFHETVADHAVADHHHLAARRGAPVYCCVHAWHVSNKRASTREP